MGGKHSRDLNDFPEDERYFGFHNFGNTCYFNSVLQVLYFCPAFRAAVLNTDTSALANPSAKNGNSSTNLLLELVSLFEMITTNKKRCGVITPRKFFSQLRTENELFNSTQQQDAQEFLNYLLNRIAELLVPPDPRGNMNQSARESKTWVHELFEGTLTNETKCLCCETVTTRDESFLDLSVDVEQNSSISSCLRNFSSTETLGGDCKYYCETCCSEQEAQKRMRIKKLPNVLALHLKRFKYVEKMRRFTKLSYRVVHPCELRLFNTSGEAENPDRIYDLVGAVVHVGSEPSRGHYISLVNSFESWLVFDDDEFEVVEEETIEEFFGRTDDQFMYNKSSESAYILVYQARDLVCPIDSHILNNKKKSKDHKEKKKGQKVAATATNNNMQTV